MIWRELRVTLAIMIVALLVFSPAIFAGPGAAPSNYNYLALVYHIVPPAPTLHVRSYRMFFDDSGNLVVAGEVENGTTSAAYSVHVIALFYDDAKMRLATADDYTMLSRTDPGMRNPFRIILFNPPVGIASVELTLTSDATSVFAYGAATVLSQQTRTSSGLDVFGEIRNNQAGVLKSTRVVVTFYDNSGTVYEAVSGFADVPWLAPGFDSTYTISAGSHLAGLPFTVQAQGYFPL